MSPRRKRLSLAAIALAMWSTHVLVMWLRYDGKPHELLWACHLAPLILAAGCVLGSAVVTSIAVTWTSLGALLWLSNLLAAGEMPGPTPTLIHLGTLALCIVVVRTIGWDRHAWWRASLAIYALGGITRLVPSAERDDVNLAFRIWPGLEPFFPSYLWFAVFVIASLPPAFWLIGQLYARVPRSSALSPRAGVEPSRGRRPRGARRAGPSSRARRRARGSSR